MSVVFFVNEFWNQYYISTSEKLYEYSCVVKKHYIYIEKKQPQRLLNEAIVFL